MTTIADARIRDIIAKARSDADRLDVIFTTATGARFRMFADALEEQLVEIVGLRARCANVVQLNDELATKLRKQRARA
jgi:hypothetical protein